jgi:protein O-GlcNAc transferase
MKIPEPMKYREDVLQDGDIGGFGCNLNQQKLKIQGGHKSPLQSWFDEMEHFTAFEKQSQVQCDITIEKPTFIVKLDATVNMYHHFCDFVNLYLTMHLNNSLQSLDRSNVLIWDTIPYRSNFAVSWEAFLKDVNVDLLDLSGFRGKTICFNDIVFSLLPRMVFGMYYNMPLIPGCHKSGVFQAFRDHMIHRLNIRDSFQYLDSNTQKPRNEIRITIIVRNTKYRKIINLEELVKTLRMKSKRFNVKTIDFSHQMPFKKQLEVTANTDILIGMHGAGLTHTLFLPDYAVLFELFNCDDENCYKDLSRLRGVKYMTWEKRSLVFPEDEGKHPTLGTSHAKFTNYAFDPKEFLRLVLIAVKHVKAERSLFIQTKLGITIDDARDEL